MTETLVFFRNDDVNVIEPGLVEVTDLLTGFGAPVSHAVEPANISADCRRFLLERSDRDVEIIQHGYAHTQHGGGEFGGARSRVDQAADLRAGLEIMEGEFGDRFFRAMSFPFGGYNQHSIPLLDELGYPVVSCHWRHQLSRRVFYGLGQALGKGRWLDKHVSHHLGRYPGTGVTEISVTISPICRYHLDQGPTACDFLPLPALQEIFRTCRRRSPVVGIVLHHRYRAGQPALAALADFVGWIKDLPDVRFTNLREIFGLVDSRQLQS